MSGPASVATLPVESAATVARDMPRDRSFPLLLLCFFLSGLAALIYETAWTREFSFVFGTSELAVVTVLAAYMGGLAGGAAVAGRIARRVSRPVLTYGLLELGIALAALAVPLEIAASRWLYVAVFGGREALPDAGGLATSLFYLACSFLILLVPTGMMGATLPLLARHAVREEEQIGRRVGLLYSVNTVGAVVGTVIAAFWLLPAIGLRATIAAAAGANGLVFLAASVLARATKPLEPAPEPTAAGPDEPADRRARWILPLILASGFVSFTYEVMWVRLVGHLIGSGTQAFATMLASFLAGIAIGSAVASRLAATARGSVLGFGVAQLGIAGMSIAAFAAVNRVASFHGSGAVAPMWSDVGACMVTLFPAALCIGATFPFAVRMLARERDDAGPASARVYSANTVGAIAGAVCAGFLLVPGLGFEGTLAAGVAINLALALGAALLFSPRRPLLAGAAVAGGVALAVFPPATPWAMLRATSLVGTTAWGPVKYLGVGRSSTVLVTEQRLAWSLRNNGLPEAGMPRNGLGRNQGGVTRWLTALPALARPEARSLLLVGLGGGMAIEVVPDSIERIDVIELEPKVVAANRLVANERWRDPLSDPRVRIHVNDARNALLLGTGQFDVIVSQPSHPWAGGAANLYTREFFELARHRLSPDGVFVQWIGLPFVDTELFRSLLASLTAVFPHVQAYRPPPSGSVLFLASNAPIDMAHSVPRALAAAPEPFALIGIEVPEDVTSNLLLDEDAVRELARGAAENRDGHNRLQSRSARLRPDESLMMQIDDLVAPVDPLVRGVPEGTDVFYVLRHLHEARARRVAASLPDPIDRAVGEALIDVEQGKRNTPRQKLEAALARDPRHVEARAALLRLSSGEIARGANVEEILPLPLSDAERTLAAAWLARARDPHGQLLLALDSELAAVPLRYPLGVDAVKLRIQARLASGDPERVKEAVAIAGESLANRSDPASILLRAEASAAVGDHLALLETLGVLINELDPREPSTPALVRRARQLARATPDDAELHTLRTDTLTRLGVRANPHARPAEG